MSEKRTKFHYTFLKTFNIASIYEDDMIICKDMLIEEETLELKKDNQRQKTLKNKHWREIQARANAYNRIISSLENRIPHHIVEELRNAPLLDCDYEGVESNE